jgi:hypothetical protein
MGRSVDDTANIYGKGHEAVGMPALKSSFAPKQAIPKSDTERKQRPMATDFAV